MATGETASDSAAGRPPPPHLNGPPTPAPEPAPAAVEAGPVPSRRERAAWYAGAVALTAVLLFAGLRLDAVNLKAPLYYDIDAPLIMPLVKSVLERNSPVGHWRNDRLGYPGGQELYDFPVVDHLHFFLIWLIGLVVPNWVVVYNLYFLLTWPLTTLTATLALRWLGLSLPLAAAGGVLYAFLPYHYLRGESHYFLAAYWLVPLSTLPALAIARGDFPFFRRVPGSGGTGPPACATAAQAGGPVPPERGTTAYRWPLADRAALGHVVLAAATATAGAYYAFFACALYAAAAVYAVAVFRTWRAVASAGLLVAAVVCVGLLQHLPAVGHSAAHGPNWVTERQPEDAEVYGLKVPHLVLPVDGHRLAPLARVKARYNGGNRPLQNENACAALGLVGTAGLLVLVGAAVLPGRRGWPLGPAAFLAAFILLFSLVGGFGSVFNILVFDQIRCLNRFSIYLAFLCLFAVLWLIDRFLADRPRWARPAAAAGLVVLGVADQTPALWFSDGIVELIADEAGRYEADARFYARVEEAVPGGRVLMLPYMPYPETPPLHRLRAYEHMRGYLHTDTLAWGYGMMKHRPADEWYRSVANAPPAELVRRAVARGFDGVVVDGRGFLSQAEANKLAAGLREACGPARPAEVVHEDGRQVFLDLRPARDRLRAQDPVQFAAWEREEREWACVCWLKGLYQFDNHGPPSAYRWGSPSGTMLIDNPSDRTRVFRLSFLAGTDLPGEFGLRIDGRGLQLRTADGGHEPWADEFVLRRDPRDWDRNPPVHGLPRSYLVEVPPGEHLVRFTCTPPPGFVPADPRPLCYYLKDVGFVEVK
ncbi:MAG: hypothetical protein K2X87_04595 [Gemmataceae bacterium]|nr:hypothetical protein [Gemmataceae bacterium]